MGDLFDSMIDLLGSAGEVGDTVGDLFDPMVDLLGSAGDVGDGTIMCAKETVYLFATVGLEQAFFQSHEEGDTVEGEHVFAKGR